MTNETFEEISGYPPAAVHTVEETRTTADGLPEVRAFVILEILGHKYRMGAADAGIIGRALDMAADEAAQANTDRAMASRDAILRRARQS